MRRFVAKVAGFVLLQILLMAALVGLRLDVGRSFSAAMVDKHELARTAPGPRILIAGGSNVAFGIDSPEVHRALGYYPVNLGLAAHVGLDFMLNEAGDLARPGDVIVLSIEYEHFVRDVTQYTAWHILQTEPCAIRYFNWPQQKMLLDTGLLFLRKLAQDVRRGAKRGKRRPRLDRGSFNHYGDVVFHHHAQRTYSGTSANIGFPVDEAFMQRTIDKLNRFAEGCQSRGIRVYFLYPCLADDALTAFRTGGFARLESALSNELHVPRLVELEESVYRKQLFYDTWYHLGRAGKRRRTNLMISRLKSHLDPPPATMAGTASRRL